MNDAIRISIGAITLVASLVLLNVSSPNYTAVLSMSAGASVLAAVMFWASSRKAAGHKVTVLRLAVAISVVGAGCAGWGVLGTLS